MRGGVLRTPSAFNLGSLTDKRRRTPGVLEIEDGHLTHAEIITLP